MIVESKEVELLFRVIKDTYGYDLESFSSEYSKRRMRSFVEENNLNHICELIPKVLLDHGFFYRLLSHMTVNYTEFFRDPQTFKEMRVTLVPEWHTHPLLKIWHVGCSTGAEPYSLAILMLEEGLLENCIIYATDMNHQILASAQEGSYTLEALKLAERNYHDSGGKQSLRKYFSVSGNHAQISEEIKSAITFAHHNIISDAGFGEMNTILFRNVLIYFNEDYQNKALATVTSSLAKSGYLILGDKESLQLRNVQPHYTKISSHYIYRKI